MIGNFVSSVVTSKLESRHFSHHECTMLDQKKLIPSKRHRVPFIRYQNCIRFIESAFLWPRLLNDVIYVPPLKQLCCKNESPSFQFSIFFFSFFPLWADFDKRRNAFSSFFGTEKVTIKIVLCVGKF